MLDAIDARAYADERAKAASSNPGLTGRRDAYDT